MLEREILGCILKDNKLINETVLQVAQFKEQSHQLLFQSMQKLSMEDKAIDKVTLLTDNYEYLQQLGGIDFITSLETQGTLENFETYEKSMIELYKQRESESTVKQWLSGKDKNAHELIDGLQKLSELDVVEEVDKNDVLNAMYDLPYQEAPDNGVMSGLRDLDEITGGFQKASSVILGARPSIGKTATMLKFALSATKQNVIPVMFTLEMPNEQLTRRLIATIGKINLFYARNPHSLIESKKQAWQRAIKELYKLDYEMFEKSNQTLQYMRSQVRKVKRKYPDKEIIILIDYLTLINAEGNYQSDHSRISAISKGLKAMAKDYDCPVITLAQLSRGLEQRQDKRPMLSDLRESGSIEEDADMVAFLYRDSYYNKESDDDSLEINIAKNRNGPTGTATVYYNKATGEMGDLSGH